MPANPVEIKESRINEDYIVQQWEQATGSSNWSEHKRRIENDLRLYRGDLRGAYPEEIKLPKEPLVENRLKNAIHDLARLCKEARGATVFVPRGEGAESYKDAQIREAIADTLWMVGNGPGILGRLYMDLIGSGFACLPVFYNKKSDYAQFMRLDPRYCYPDVRNGVLQDLLYTETLKVRELARMYPKLGLQNAKNTDETAQLVSYYDDEEVVEAIILTKGSKAIKGQTFITQRWPHELGCPPVAFVSLDTWDGSFRGLLDQVGGPMVASNKIVRFIVDYIESMVHAPFEAKNVMNADELPSPDTIYRHDPNSEPNNSFMRRVAPAAPAGAVFGILQYLDQQASGEAIQPPARVGQVSQAIASGSFVASTQGQLTSVVKDLQELMGQLRMQLTTLCMKVEEKFCDHQKPLFRPVGRKNTYTPSKDIDEWYYHRVEFGAAAGLDRMNADVRVLQHRGAGLISKRTAREQIDYVSDPTAEQDIIDMETSAEALLQRFAADPTVPLPVLAQTFLTQAEGKSLVEAMKEIAPQLVEMQQQETPPAAPEQIPGPEQVAPAAEQEALLAGGTTPVEEGGVVPEFAPPMMPQLFIQAPGS